SFPRRLMASRATISHSSVIAKLVLACQPLSGRQVIPNTPSISVVQFTGRDKISFTRAGANIAKANQEVTTTSSGFWLEWKTPERSRIALRWGSFSVLPAAPPSLLTASFRFGALYLTEVFQRRGVETSRAGLTSSFAMRSSNRAIVQGEALVAQRIS